VKEVWINDLYYGNYKETDYKFDIFEKIKKIFSKKFRNI